MLIPESVWERLIIPADIRRQFEAAVQSLVEDRAPGPVTILLTGDPGTGKTSLLQLLRKNLGCPSVWLHASDLRIAYRMSGVTPGKGAVHGWLPDDPGLLCLDELHMGMPSDTYDGSDAYGCFPDDSTTPLSEWLAGEVGDLRERGRRILLIATAWSPDDIAPAARAAFGRHIHLPLPDEDDRRRILALAITDRDGGDISVDCDIGEVATEMARRSAGRSGRELQMLVNHAIGRAADAAIEAKSAGPIRLSRYLLLRELPEPDSRSSAGAPAEETWPGVELPATAVSDIHHAIELTRAKADEWGARKKGEERIPGPMPRLLLCGPAGSGKEGIVQWIAASTGLTVVDDQETRDATPGECATAVHGLFARAVTLQPSILVLRDIDVHARSRTGSPDDARCTAIVQQLLVELVGLLGSRHSVLVVATATDPKMIDGAVRSRMAIRETWIPAPNPNSDGPGDDGPSGEASGSSGEVEEALAGALSNVVLKPEIGSCP